MKTLIAVATQCNESSFKNTRLSKSLTHHEENTITTFDLQPTYKNTSGLCAVYNNYFTLGNLKKYDCILFVHDDVFIDSINFLVEIRNAFKRGFDIIGVAGGSNLRVQKPCLWHLLCRPDTISGIVSHYNNNTDYSPTIFGQTPKEVILLDGVFLAVRTKSISEKKVKFDLSKALEKAHILLGISVSVENIDAVIKIIKKSDTEFTATATNKIGPFNASFTGDIELKDLNPPNSYKIVGQGNSAVGFASGEADVKLEENNGVTTLTYSVEANVGGKIAQVGSRLINMTAKKMADIFFGKFSELISPQEIKVLDEENQLKQLKKLNLIKK